MKSAKLVLVCLLLSLCQIAHSVNLSKGGYMGCHHAKEPKNPITSGIQPRSASGNILYGVDVSTYQGTINWDSMKAAKDFVIIRASYGVNNTDDQFRRNRDEARRVGILRGFYHFAYPDYGTNANDEADTLLNAVGPLQSGELLVIDYELTDYSNPGPWVATFCERIHSRVGFWPLIYMDLWHTQYYNWSQILSDGVPLWLARWDNVADPTVNVGGSPWSYVPMKQYWDKGSVIGISPIDLDVFNGDANKFKTYAAVAPSITVQPVGGSNNTGSPITLSITATGTPSPTYQWRLNGGNISGATSITYVATVSGNYDCVVTNSAGSVTSNLVLVTINTPISIVTQPVSQTCHFGATATLSLVAAGTSPTYSWYCNGRVVTGATSASYTTNVPATYWCVVSNSFSSVTSSIVTVSIDNAVTVDSIASAKLQPNGVIVAIKNKNTVTESYTSFFYSEDPDRTAGIKVLPSSSASVLPKNTNSIIYGKMSTVGNERTIVNGIIANAGNQPAITPLAMTCASTSQAIAQGLLVTICGRASVDPNDPGEFTLTDGSSSVRVYLHGVAPPSDGTNVIVQGAIGQDLNGIIIHISNARDIR